MLGRRGSSWRPLRGLLLLTTSLFSCCQLGMSYDLDPDSKESILETAKDVATDMMSFYPGNKPGGTPGYIPLPYYWWEAGALMGTLVDYWYYTGDDRWNDDTTEGLLFQVGQYDDYMPMNQTHTEGNDDQGFWGLAVMSAAEYKFPNPPDDKPQWLALAQAVFNTQAARWDMDNCNGGLRWQIFPYNNGYDYKNTISQACFFALGARLALYTGNDSYAEWAVKTWDWTNGAGYIDDKFWVYDGAYIDDNCTKLTPYQWTYNAGGFILGAAAMYKYTGSSEWKDRVDNLLSGVEVFFTGDDEDIMTEVACEPVNLCNIDQESFKAYLSRWLAASTKWYPGMREKVMPWIRASSVAATKQCTGGDNGRMCGLKWANNSGRWDGTTGLGQQMAALEITLANLIDDSRPPVTASSGGTSEGDPSAGGTDIGRVTEVIFAPITAKDRAGAGVLTALATAGLVACVIWMMVDETSDKPLPEQWADFRTSFRASAAAGFGVLALAALVRRKLKGEKGRKGSEEVPAPGMNGVVGGEKSFNVNRVSHTTNRSSMLLPTTNHQQQRYSLPLMHQPMPPRPVSEAYSLHSLANSGNFSLDRSSLGPVGMPQPPAVATTMTPTKMPPSTTTYSRRHSRPNSASFRVDRATGMPQASPPPRPRPASTAVYSRHSRPNSASFRLDRASLGPTGMAQPRPQPPPPPPPPQPQPRPASTAFSHHSRTNSGSWQPGFGPSPMDTPLPRGRQQQQPDPRPPPPADDMWAPLETPVTAPRLAEEPALGPTASQKRKLLRKSLPPLPKE